MAEGYGTGMSSKPVDFASPGLAFFNSAIQARKQEISQHMTEANENEKKIIKALDIKSLGDVSGMARERMDKDISSFRQELIQRYQKTQGRLTGEDRRWLEAKSIDIQNNVNTAKNQLKALAQAKQTLMTTDPKMYTDFEGLTHAIVADEEKIGRGDLMANPMNTLMSFIAPPTPEMMLADQVKKSGIKFDSEPIKKDNGDGTFTVTNKLTEAGKQQFRDWASKNPQIARQFTTIGKDGIPVYDEDAQERAMENMFGETGTIRVKSRSTSGVDAAFKNNLTPVDMDFGGKIFNVAKIDTPKTMTGLPAEGINVVTGAKVPSGGTTQATFIGPGKDDQGNPVLLFTMKTPGTMAPVMIGGKQAYKGSGKSWETKNPLVAEDIEKNPEKIYKESGGEVPATGEKGKPYENVRYVVEKKDGQITITPYGDLPQGTGLMGMGIMKSDAKKDVPMSEPVVLKAAMDKDAVEAVSVPLTPETYGYFSKTLAGKKIDGVPAQQYLDQLVKGSTPAPAKKGAAMTKEEEFRKKMGL